VYEGVTAWSRGGFHFEYCVQVLPTEQDWKLCSQDQNAPGEKGKGASVKSGAAIKPYVKQLGPALTGREGR